MEILSAQANGFTLFVLAGLIAYEGDQPARLAAAAGRAADPGRRLARHRRQPRRDLAARARGPQLAEHRGLVPAHPHRSVRVHRDCDRRRGDPRHRVGAGRRGRGARGRGDHAASPPTGSCATAAGSCSRRRPEGTSVERDRKRDRDASARRERPRPARVGGVERLPVAIRARAGRMPATTATRFAASSRARSARSLRHRAHDPAGRSRRGEPAPDGDRQSAQAPDPLARMREDPSRRPLRGRGLPHT